MEAPARTDRRRARTRAALLRAGQALFAARSVDGVSIDDIVAAADVAKGSFYNHFPDKEALARAIGEEVRRAAEALAAEVGAGFDDPAERVARALCGFVRQAAAEPERARAMQRLFPAAAVPDAPMNAGVRADVAAGLEAGRFKGLGQEAAVLTAVGLVQAAVARAVGPESAKPTRLAREMAFALLRGLGVNPDEAQVIAARASTDILEWEKAR
ncbi:MAG: helix-turn-helix domain-containing protein [Phenylobacterium sp.]|uniref:TetR/AcrR family transcriptional regulator n=1 Tax=Phenylobacterium sp. TaxID=1871053 RepID=UPI002A311181|nr:helix-turn-helix domain-containing protein [Phenylobacterium sp.]MDD3836661.1 helix-turn-helix domain containing protein [Phenylobacterium sp.]MDX9998409.1 helix-turn-helix domain-containing protein [Phenylobacterium sp.]